MKRPLKLASFVLIGWISSLALWLLLMSLRSHGPWSPPERSWQALFSLALITILSWLLGGGVTGYLCSQHIKTRSGFVGITPGLYFLLLEAAVIICCPDRVGQLPGLVGVMLVVGVLLFLVSWAGVGVGHYIRREVLKPPK
jgi:hypothetical protein